MITEKRNWQVNVLTLEEMVQFPFAFEAAWGATPKQICRPPDRPSWSLLAVSSPLLCGRRHRRSEVAVGVWSLITVLRHLASCHVRFLLPRCRGGTGRSPSPPPRPPPRPLPLPPPPRLPPPQAAVAGTATSACPGAAAATPNAAPAATTSSVASPTSRTMGCPSILEPPLPVAATAYPWVRRRCRGPRAIPTATRAGLHHPQRCCRIRSPCPSSWQRQRRRHLRPLDASPRRPQRWGLGFHHRIVPAALCLHQERLQADRKVMKGVRQLQNLPPSWSHSTKGPLRLVS